MPTPAFVLYEQIVNLCRGVFVPLDTTADGFQIDAARLEAIGRNAEAMALPNAAALIIDEAYKLAG